MTHDTDDAEGHVLLLRAFKELVVDSDDLTANKDYGGYEGVFAALAECDHIMPDELCEDLDMGSGKTYAQGVENERQAVKESGEMLAKDRDWSLCQAFRKLVFGDLSRDAVVISLDDGDTVTVDELLDELESSRRVLPTDLRDKLGLQRVATYQMGVVAFRMLD